MGKVKFDFGNIYMTCGINQATQENEKLCKFVEKALQRHLEGDWGDLCEEDRQSNEEALVNGDRLFSSYKFNDDIRVWIITECDRSATTILFPDEY